jgi:hypothetical protein
MSNKDNTHIVSLLSSNPTFKELYAVANTLYGIVAHSELLRPIAHLRYVSRLSNPGSVVTEMLQPRPRISYSPLEGLSNVEAAGILIYFKCYQEDPVADTGELEEDEVDDYVFALANAPLPMEKFIRITKDAAAGFKLWISKGSPALNFDCVPAAIRQSVQACFRPEHQNAMRVSSSDVQDYFASFIAHCYLLRLCESVHAELRVQEFYNSKRVFYTGGLIYRRDGNPITLPLFNVFFKQKKISFCSVDDNNINLVVDSQPVTVDARIPELAKLLGGHL